MILSFKTKWRDGNPNYFKEKIWLSLVEKSEQIRGIEGVYQTFVEMGNYSARHYQKFEEVFHTTCGLYSKPHTIRKGKRWKAGMKIHFAINPRSKNYFQFAPTVKVKSVQKIVIKKFLEDVKIFIDDVLIYTDSHQTTLEELAQNDGFDSVEDFIEFFFPNNKTGPFEGQIIHWTELRY